MVIFVGPQLKGLRNDTKESSALSSGLLEVKKFPSVNPYKCVQTATMHAGIKTTICVKPVSVDKFVSGSILSQGVWEKNIVNLVLKALEFYPSASFLDVGANIGIYTVLAAAAGRRVVAVDAVMENLAYISTSLNQSNTGHFVSLLNNPVSDKVEVLYPVTDNKDNQGGTRLVPGDAINSDTRVTGPAVNTTTLSNVLKFTNANSVILKMDVEGFECKVLHPYLLHGQSPHVFLPYIILEWMHIKVNLDSNCPDLAGLVDSLFDSGYDPFDLYTEKRIDRTKTDWKSYTDVLWVHKDAKKLL